MKILWVKAGGLVPLDSGGKIRSFNILKELAKRHGITVFTFYAKHLCGNHDEIDGCFERVVSLPTRIPAPGTPGDYVSFVRHLFSPYPHALAKYCSPGVARRLREIVHEQRFDLIVCDFIFAAGVIPWDLQCPKILFTHNAEAIIWRRHYQVSRNPIWKLVFLRECRAMERSERHYLERSDHILTVSDVDREYFAGFIDREKISTIPTGVDTSFFHPMPGRELPNVLVFTGSMDWMANEDGILYFLSNILPRIRTRVPNVQLWIVGRNPSRRLQTAATHKGGVVVTGRVEDVRPYIRDASVYVVPLRVGSGSRLKIFEAMAMGKAIVSTAVGAEGLPVEDGKNISIANGEEEFSDRVVQLLSNRALRDELGHAARGLVEGRYSWNSVASVLDSVLTSLAENAPILSTA